jgi:hypothetical protein
MPSFIWISYLAIGVITGYICGSYMAWDQHDSKKLGQELSSEDIGWGVAMFFMMLFFWPVLGSIILIGEYGNKIFYKPKKVRRAEAAQKRKQLEKLIDDD